jgi:hypothetical protein
MKRLKKVGLIFLTISLVLTSLYSVGWAQEKWDKNDPVTHEWNMIDMLVARPLGVVGWIVGSGVFVLSLPFSIPTGGVNDVAQAFVVKPFQFAFGRRFPDDDM